MNINEFKKAVRRKLGLGSNNEKAFSGEDIIASANDYIQEAVATIVNCSGEWEFNGEWSECDIIAGKKEYPLTTDIPLLNLKRIEINFTGEPNQWQIAKLVDLRTKQVPFSNDSSSNSPEVDLFDNSIIFLNTPTTNGKIRIFYSKASEEYKSGSVYSVITNIGGSGYVEGNTFTLQGGNNNCTLKATIVNGSGEIQGVEVINRGTGYVEGTTYNVIGGSGSGAKITVNSTDLQNINLLPAVQKFIMDNVCLEYAMAFDMTTKINTFRTNVINDESKIKEYYSNRTALITPSIQPEYINMN